MGVEALTLPYGEGRFEVACNLLCPDVGSVESIDAKVKEWSAAQVKNEDLVVEKAYRVGTTSDQCLEAISLCDSTEGAIAHDEAVMELLGEYLTQS